MIIGIELGSIWVLIVTVLIFERFFADEPKPDADKPPKPNDEWCRVWYDAAHSDIQWAKERGWAALQSLVVLEAAFVAVKQTPWPINHDALTVLAAGAAIVATVYLVDLHRFAKNSRIIADRILDDVSEQKYYLGKRRARDRHHVFYLAAKLLMVGLATTLTILTVG
jgi:hypothetical protein